jgi:hypothetical protein
MTQRAPSPSPFLATFQQQQMARIKINTMRKGPRIKLLPEADGATRRRLSAFSRVLQAAFEKDQQGIQRVPGALLSRNLPVSLAQSPCCQSTPCVACQEAMDAIMDLNAFFAPMENANE